MTYMNLAVCRQNKAVKLKHPLTPGTNFNDRGGIEHRLINFIQYLNPYGCYGCQFQVHYLHNITVSYQYTFTIYLSLLQVAASGIVIVIYTCVSLSSH